MDAQVGGDARDGVGLLAVEAAALSQVRDRGADRVACRFHQVRSDPRAHVVARAFALGEDAARTADLLRVKRAIES